MIGLARTVGVLATISVLASTWASLPPVRTGHGHPPSRSASAKLDVDSLLKMKPARPEMEQAGSPGEVPDCSKLKCVALTMDDGPAAETAEVLALLKKKKVRATFFVLGSNAAAHPELLRRMVADGHVIANHSWNHPQYFRLSKKAIARQFDRTDAVIKRITGKRPTLTRTPYGQVNARIRSVAKSRGHTLVMWDVDPRDWKNRKTKTVIRRVVAQTERGSIILTHDIWPTTRKAYGRIIDQLRTRGYTLVTVPELLGSRAKPGRVILRG